MSVEFLSLFLIFELIQWDSLVNRVAFKHFQNHENLICTLQAATISKAMFKF